MHRLSLILAALLPCTLAMAQESPYWGVTVANGTLGLVSSPEPMKISCTVLEGVYDKHGRGRVNNYLPNINPVEVELRLGGTLVTGNNVQDHTQTLDMKTGTFQGSFDFRGTHVAYRYTVLRQLGSVALMEIEVDAPETVKMDACLVHTVPSPLVPVQSSSNDYSFARTGRSPYRQISTVAKTPSGETTIAAASTFITEEEENFLHTIPDNDRHLLRFEKQVSGKYVFQAIGVLTSSIHSDDPVNQADRMLSHACFQKDNWAAHESAWAKLWESDIEIEGDETAQQEVRSMLYHLYAFTSEGHAKSVSPMGLSGLGYNGHVFWDCETFVFPVLLLLHPEVAKSMVDYRFERLDAAKNNAASFGYRGAMFPWESAASGGEECPPRSLSGTFQHHVTADVAIAAWKYWLVTGDRDYLRDRIWPILKSTAEFWESRAQKGPDGVWHIYNVMGADEWARFVDDDAYTNGAAKRNLEYAVEAGKELGLNTPPAWKEIAEGMYFKKLSGGVTSEHGSYSGAEIKQADVNLLAFPLGIVSSREQALKDLDYYSTKVPKKGTPAMTECVFSVICSRNGRREDAARWFYDSYRPNALPPFGVIAEFKGGDNPYFLTGAGGSLQAVLMGFAGLDFNPRGGICQQPHAGLPQGWKRLTIKGVGPNKETVTVK